jgi:hypothetical protein
MWVGGSEQGLVGREGGAGPTPGPSSMVPPALQLY